MSKLNGHTNKLEGKKTNIEAITAARGSVYGPFIDNAVLAVALKNAFRVYATDFESLDADVKEGLDLIALKISRILTGDPLYLDNWDDIAGYAKIVADRIRNG